MVERAIATGQAPGAGRDRRTRQRRAPVHRRVPLRHARVRRHDRHRRAPGPPPHPGDELVVARRAPLRRVRLVVRRRAPLRHQPPAHRHRLQHERRAPRGRRAHGVRGARRAGRAHRRHDLPDVPRAAPPRAGARVRAEPDRSAPCSAARCRARSELFYADLFASRATGLPVAAGHARHARPARRAASARTSCEHDLFDFLLLSLPDNDTHSHKHGPHAQVASIAAADRQIERIMHAAGGTDAFLEEHAVIVVSDHSHAPVEEEIAFVDAFDGWDVAAPTRSGRRGGRPRARRRSPSARRSARRCCTRCSRRAASGARGRSCDTARELQGVDLSLWRERRRGGDRLPRAASCASRRASGVRDRRGASWDVRGRPRRAAARARSGGEIDMPTYPDGAGPRLGGADLPDVGRRAAQRGARLRVPRLGRRGPPRRRQPRLAAPRRLARACSLVAGADEPAGDARRRRVEPRRRRPDVLSPLPRRR